MARERVLKVVIAGDADKLDRELKKANGSLEKLGKQTQRTSTLTSKGLSGMKVAAVGAAGALGGLAIAGKEVAQASIEAEAATAKVKKMVENAGISWKKHGDRIDQVIQKHSQLTGIDDEDLAESFANMVRTTGNLNEAFKLNALAADLSRSKGVGLAQAQSLLARVYNGAFMGLKRLGIQFEPTTAAQDKLRESTKNATDEQIRAAKETDKLANRQASIAALQKAFGGQAKTYGETTAGSIDRAGVAFENLEETIGDSLAPTIEDVANGTADFINEMQDGTGAGGRFADKLRDIWSEAKPIVTWIGRATKNVAQFTSEHPNVGKLAAAIVGVGVAVKGLKFVSAATGFTDLVKAGRGAARSLKRIFASAGTAAGEQVAANAASGMTAKSGAVTSASKSIGKKAGKGLVVGIVLALPALVPEIRSQLNKLPKTDIGKYLFAPLNFGKKIANGISGLLGGDGIGKGALTSAMKGAASGAVGGLMGASPVLAPFAAAGGAYGLHVSSGLRPGAITKSGNPSHHGAGHAIDMSGPPAKMLAYFRAMKAKAGGRLAELIYTPGGVGIKNGRPYRYTGAVAADHFDHVHVAYTGGRGDGIGRKPGTGDGLGKGSIMNLWTTAGGSANVANLAAAVALAESGGNPAASNKNSNGTIDRGLWQINSVHGKLSTFDKQANARAAVKISSGGKNWRPWVAYTTGAYKKFLGGSGVAAGGDAPSASEVRERRHDAAEKSGSRLVNKIAGKFSGGIAAATRSARSIGTGIEDAGAAYGRLERRFGQTDEDLGTSAGRAKRVDELQVLKQEKAKQITAMKKRLAQLKKAEAGLVKTVAGINAKLNGKNRARGAKAVSMRERRKKFQDDLIEIRAEIKGLGGEILDAGLDLGDLDKDIADVKGTEDTAGPTANDKLGEALNDIDLQERAGVLSPDAANAARQATLQAALSSGQLDQRQQWEVMGQLRDAQQAATEAQQQATQAYNDQTQALRDLKASMDANTAVAGSIMAVQGREALTLVAGMISGEVGNRVAARGVMRGMSGQTSRL